jgi:hypothetical protein
VARSYTEDSNLECLKRAGQEWPLGYYYLAGPNSNSYPGYLARRCCSKRFAPTGPAPGWHDEPPKAVRRPVFDAYRAGLLRDAGRGARTVEVRLDGPAQARIANEAWRAFSSEHGGRDLVEMRRGSPFADADYQRVVERIAKRELDDAFFRALKGTFFSPSEWPWE